MAKKATKDVGIELNGAESGAKIERIRTLIFGEQMKEYGQQFGNVQRDLERLQKELARLGGDLREGQKTLQKRVDEQDERQTKALRDVDDRLSNQLHESDKKSAEAIEELRHALRQLEESTRQELQTVLTSLDNSKMDRLTLGEMLVQMGSTLKESDAEQEAADLRDELMGEAE